MAGGGAAAGGGEASRRPAEQRGADTAVQQALAFINAGGERVRASRAAPAPAADDLDMLNEELVQPQIEGDVLEPAGLPTVASLLHPKCSTSPLLVLVKSIPLAY